MNKKIALAISAVIALVIALMCLQHKNIKALKSELKRQQENVKVLEGNQKNYIINDSVNVSQIRALQLSNKELQKRYSEISKQVKKVSEGSKKEATQYTQISVNKVDTLVYVKTDTFIPCKTYISNYAKVTLCEDTAVVITNDTLHQVVSNVYKHRFLWWKWGLENIEQDVWLSSGQPLYFDKFIKIK